jgi:hypothetical protein
VMFLVAHDDMIDQWTLTWKETSGNIHSFTMPKITKIILNSLRFSLDAIWFAFVFLCCQKSEFS